MNRIVKIVFGWSKRCICPLAKQRNTIRSSISTDRKIEKEARRDYRYWDRAARRIYDLRMERDRKIQRILTPAQFNLYVRFVREHPQRIHDYRGWYANPRYPDRRPSHDCRRYEDNYWNYR